MTLEMARERLTRAGQDHVLAFWERLGDAERRGLLEQVAALDFGALDRMRRMLSEPAPGAAAAGDDPPPADVESIEGTARAEATGRGEAELRAGRVGVLLVAGGQGSRLGFEGPKGAFPIGPISDAPLFSFHARKVAALARRHGARVPLYVMTSRANDAATRACFERHRWFNLRPEDVRFFVQGMWPALDADGRILLESPGRLFLSPDGHGGTIAALDAGGELADMERRGLTTLFYFQVDNPLVEVADAAFVGLHLLRGADISIKVCEKRDPHEGLGVVVNRGGRYAMVEYTELSERQKQRQGPDGRLYYRYGSVAIHVFALPFLRQEAARPLPLHLAHKRIACCGPDGVVRQPAAANGYKFEKFIFDVLPDARRLVCLAFDRREEFSPVKNAQGADSPASCRRDLSEKWARWLDAAGCPVPRDREGHPRQRIEIDPLYANSAGELAARRPLGIGFAQPVWLREEV
jgi:UDP-N-acetylglucosamine/UDP-N-acetylgalactosamine diphosphorylase